MDKEETGATPPVDRRTVTLDVPFKRGEATVEKIEVLRPAGSGWLRGVSMLELLNLNAGALAVVLPRVTQPALTEAEVRMKLDAADLLTLGTEVSRFLVPRSLTASESPGE